MEWDYLSNRCNYRFTVVDHILVSAMIQAKCTFSHALEPPEVFSFLSLCASCL